MEHPGLETLGKRLDYWQRVCWPLGIQHWRINLDIVEETHGGPNAAASVRPADSYDTADLEFRASYIEEASDYEIDCTIVHELMHIVMRDIDATVESVETWMPHATHVDFNERYCHEQEGLIDRAARAIVEAHKSPWKDVVD